MITLKKNNKGPPRPALSTAADGLELSNLLFASNMAKHTLPCFDGKTSS